VTLTFAFECYADEDVVIFLRKRCKLRLKGRHSYGQGEVVNDLLKTKQANVGMVDEDPGSSHHPLRDAMQVIHTAEDLEVRQKAGRHLIILRPELEDCFIRSMHRAAVPLTIPPTAKELQKVLNIPKHPSHGEFREQLEALHKAATTRHIPTFITDLEEVIRKFG